MEMDKKVQLIDMNRITHVCFNTGYTSRVLRKHIGDLCDAFEVDEDLYEEFTSEGFLRYQRVLYIDDRIYGSGFYPISNDTDKIEKVKNLIDSANLEADSGSIVFGVDSAKEAFEILNCLINIDYCAYLHISNLYRLFYLNNEENDIRVLFMRFSTESG